MWLCGRRMRVSIHLTGVKGSVLSLPYLGMDLVGPLLVHSTGRFLMFFVAEVAQIRSGGWRIHLCFNLNIMEQR